MNERRAVLLAVLLLLIPAAGLGESRGGDRTIRVGNLVYAGTRTSKCFSNAFLEDVFQEAGIRTDRRFERVHLHDADELMAHPFSIMNGEGSFELTEEERENLKAYLLGGGFLLASAGCSSPPWASSMRRELELMFGRDQVAEVPADHPLFHNLNDIDEVPLKSGGFASLQGVTVDGRLVCLFSPEGLNNTAQVPSCCCCGGNEVKVASRVVANALIYSLIE